MAEPRPGEAPPAMEARLYGTLFRSQSPGDLGDDWLADLNPDSLTIVRGALAGPALAGAQPGDWCAPRLPIICDFAGSRADHVLALQSHHSTGERVDALALRELHGSKDGTCAAGCATRRRRLQKSTSQARKALRPVHMLCACDCPGGQHAQPRCVAPSKPLARAAACGLSPPTLTLSCGGQLPAGAPGLLLRGPRLRAGRAGAQPHLHAARLVRRGEGRAG